MVQITIQMGPHNKKVFKAYKVCDWLCDNGPGLEHFASRYTSLDLSKSTTMDKVVGIFAKQIEEDPARIRLLFEGETISGRRVDCSSLPCFGVACVLSAELIKALCRHLPLAVLLR